MAAEKQWRGVWQGSRQTDRWREGVAGGAGRGQWGREEGGLSDLRKAHGPCVLYQSLAQKD